MKRRVGERRRISVGKDVKNKREMTLDEMKVGSNIVATFFHSITKLLDQASYRVHNKLLLCLHRRCRFVGSCFCLRAH